MAEIKCVRCPLCNSLPLLVLGSGAQAFCSNDDCEVILWDACQSLDENLMDAHSIWEAAIERDPGLPPATP